MAKRRKPRSWTDARAKVEDEEFCRVCKMGGGLQAAHTIGRVHDPDDGKVRPDDIVPLCVKCHMDYDAHKLNLLPYLTIEEQAAAVSHVGIIGALRRLSGERSQDQDS